MSVRAIAEALDTSKSSVHRRVSQSGTGEDGEAVETTGRDGKRYPRLVPDQETELDDESEQPADHHNNGGARGKRTPSQQLTRAKSSINNIALDGAAAEIKREICRLIDELLASIKITTESN
jgi:hypothetical protein